MRNLILLRTVYWRVGFRNLSSVAENPEKYESKKMFRMQDRMSGWQIHSYSPSVEELQFSDILKKPFIRKPTELLVKVLASSVNPFDVAMMSKFLKFINRRT